MKLEVSIQVDSFLTKVSFSFLKQLSYITKTASQSIVCVTFFKRRRSVIKKKSKNKKSNHEKQVLMDLRHLILHNAPKTADWFFAARISRGDIHSSVISVPQVSRSVPLECQFRSPGSGCCVCVLCDGTLKTGESHTRR